MHVGIEANPSLNTFDHRIRQIKCFKLDKLISFFISLLLVTAPLYIIQKRNLKIHLKIIISRRGTCTIILVKYTLGNYKTEQKLKQAQNEHIKFIESSKYWSILNSLNLK